VGGSFVAGSSDIARYLKMMEEVNETMKQAIDEMPLRKLEYVEICIYLIKIMLLAAENILREMTMMQCRQCLKKCFMISLHIITFLNSGFQLRHNL